MVEYGFFETKKGVSQEVKQFLRNIGVEFDASGVEGGWIHFRVYNYTPAQEALIDTKLEQLYRE